MVLTFDTFTGTDLEFPLGRHNLSIDTGDVDASIKTSLVVGLDDVTAVNLAGSHTAVVGALGAWEATLGPAVGPAVRAEKGVFLFQAKPEFLVGVGSH